MCLSVAHWYALLALHVQVNQTILYFLKGLQAVYGNQMACTLSVSLRMLIGLSRLLLLNTCFLTSAVPPAGAYMGGYLVVRGKAAKSSDTKSLLATLTQSAFKGQRRLYVSWLSGHPFV